MTQNPPAPDLRFDWTRDDARRLYELPFPELLFQAQLGHRDHFRPDELEAARLLNIKTGGCPEDCGYCSQSARYDTGVQAQKPIALDEAVAAAREAARSGASRFCMAAAWRSPKDRDLDHVCAMVSAVKALGLSTCATLGMLTRPQAERLRDSGLDFYNHNIDSSPEFYGQIITTRTFDDRLDTLSNARAAGLKLCCGGILGLGESVDDRLAMLTVLARLAPHPESTPINLWSEVAGVPVAKTASRPDALDIVRTIAVARIMMPGTVLRLSAGRHEFSDELQALCFLAGANSIFIGDKLLTTVNPDLSADHDLIERLGMRLSPSLTKRESRPVMGGQSSQQANAGGELL